MPLVIGSAPWPWNILEIHCICMSKQNYRVITAVDEQLTLWRFFWDASRFDRDSVQPSLRGANTIFFFYPWSKVTRSYGTRLHQQLRIQGRKPSTHRGGFCTIYLSLTTGNCWPLSINLSGQGRFVMLQYREVEWTLSFSRTLVCCIICL